MDLNTYLNALMEDNGAAVANHIAVGAPSDLQIPNESGNKISILHLVAFQGLENSTRALLDANADPNILDSSGEPPIKMAIVAGHKRIIELLLDAGANVNVRMHKGETPLHTALLSEHTDIAQLLMDHGANPDVTNDQGITPRHLKGFQAMKAGGWDVSKPNTGASFVDNLHGMSEEGLEGIFSMLPLMISTRVASGEITPERATALNALLKEFEQAKQLPLEIRSTRMNEIASKLLSSMGTPQASR